MATLLQRAADGVSHQLRSGNIDRRTAVEWITRDMAEAATGHDWQLVTLRRQMPTKQLYREHIEAADDLLTARAKALAKFSRLTDAEVIAALEALALGSDPFANPVVATAAD